MTNVGLNLILDSNLDPAEAKIDAFYKSVQNLARNVQQAFASMGGTASTISNMFKPVSDGARNASQIVISESKARQQADNEETSAALNASRLRIQGMREEQAAQRAATAAKKKERDEYGQLVDQTQALTRQYYNAAAVLLKYGDASEFTAKDVELLAAKSLEANERLKSIEAGAGRFHRNVGNYSGATQYLQQSIAQLSGEIPNFFQSMRIGFMSIGNNIQPITQAIKGLRVENAQLLAQGKQTVPVLSTVIKSFLGWQTVLLVGVGLISRYGGELIDWATGADKAKEAAKRLKEQQDELNQIDQQAVQTAGEQIGTLQGLSSIIEDHTQSTEKRKNALEQLQKTYHTDLGNLSLEKAANGELADIINTRLIPAIIAAAKARAFQDKINKLTSANIDLEEKQAKAIVETAKAAERFNKADKDRAGNNQVFGGNTAGTFQTNYADKFAENAKNAYGKAIDAQDSLTKNIGENTNKINSYVKQMGESLKDAGNLSIDGTDMVEKGVKGAKDKIDDLTKSNTALADKFKVINSLLQYGQISAYDALTQKISALRNNLEDLIRIGANPEEIEKIITLINRLTSARNGYNPVDLNAAKGLKGESASDRFGKDLHEVTKGNQDRAFAFGNDVFEQVGDPRKDIKRRENDLTEAARAVNREFNKTYSQLNHIVGGPLDGFVDALFSGENAVDALGKSIKNIVASLVAAVAKAAVFSAIMSAINPMGFATGGGFLGVLGKLLPFATGGIVTGPTPALVGEAGPEAIIPLDKLNSIMGNRDLTVNIVGRTKGRDLVYTGDNYNKWVER